MSDTLSTAAESPSEAPPSAPRRTLAVARLRDLALVPAIVAVAIVGFIVNPVFLQSDNIINVLQSMSEISILVLAETVVLITGKMDLSLESTFGLAPGIAAWLIVDPAVTHGLGLHVLPAALAVPAVLLVGALIGTFNGLLIVRFG